MGTDANDLDLTTLADRAGVSPRTVRYYIHQGLLPSPGKGPNARYDAALVDRLLLIKEYQAQHLPLSEIRKRLEDLDEEGIRRALGRPLELPLSASALSYVRKVMGDVPEPGMMRSMLSRMKSRLSSPEPELFAAPLQAESRELTRPIEDRSAENQAWQVTQSTWDRTRLSRNVELNVRRPLTPRENKLVDKLLEAARKIFSEE